MPTSVSAKTESNEHLLKAVIALLSLRDPLFLKQLDKVFALAAMHESPISDMTPEAWADIRTELKIIDQFIHGDDASAPSSASEIKMAH